MISEAYLSNEDKIKKVLENLNKLLQEKNKRYGDSALTPMKLFIKFFASDSILIRLDDILYRVKNSDVLRKNDIADIMGYLTLLCVSKNWLNFNDLID